MPFFFALTLILIGIVVFWLGRQAQTGAGLPIGRVIYSDMRGWQSIEKPLFSRTHRLTGKPDYLVQHGRAIVPVEVKSARAPGEGPRRGHALQLGAYCLLIEETYRGRRPLPIDVILVGVYSHPFNSSVFIREDLQDAIRRFQRAALA